jgi:hypothetical protein
MYDMVNEMAEFARGGRSARQKAGDMVRAMKLRGRKKRGSRGAKAKSIAKKIAIGGALAAGGIGALRYGQTAAGVYGQARKAKMGRRESAAMAGGLAGIRMQEDAAAVGGYAKRQAGRAIDAGRGLGQGIKNRFKKK